MSGFEFDLLLDLPHSVSGHVLGSWIEVKCLVRITSAYCNCEKSLALREILKYKEFVQLEDHLELSQSCLNWLLAWEVRVSSMEFGMEIDVSSVSEYLRQFGSTVNAVLFRWECNDPVILYIVALRCKKLNFLGAYFSELDFAFLEILHENPNITELELNNCECQHLAGLEKLKMPKLKKLFMGRFPPCATEIHWPVSVFCESLQVFQCTHCSMEPGYIENLVRTCVHLRSIDLSDSDVNDQLLRDIVDLQPKLMHIDISGTTNQVTDDGIEYMVRNLKNLKSINIQNCWKFTNKSIHHIAKYCGSTVEEMHVRIFAEDDTVDFDSTVFYREFGQYCSALQRLSIECVSTTICTSNMIFAITHGLPALRQLVIRSKNDISDLSRKFLKLLRPDVQVLEYDYDGNSTGYDVWDMPI